MPATVNRPRDPQTGRLLPRADSPLEGPTVMDDETPAFQPVEFWNAEFPNQKLIVREPGRRAPDHDPAFDPTIKFMGGYFRATEPWQVDVIERELAGVAYRADSPNEWTCHKCGWVTKSQKAFQHHIDRKHT